eukprot:m.139492 g.139492  ORF g.139492 m.139492 type:complete len:412 (-) comp15948_c1_seq1:57-1292(-)
MASACGFCGCEIANDVHIKCAECDDLSLCLPCFTAGVEQDKHMKTHDYYVVDCIQIALYRADWQADEEVRLLNAIEVCGFGNWEAVASLMGKRTAEECKRHYTEVYLESSDAPLPEVPTGTPLKRSTKKRTVVTTTGKKNKVTNGINGNSVSGAMLFQAADGQLGPDHAGYYPRRGDYYTECAVNAERAINDVVLYSDDPEPVTELKEGLLTAYQTRMTTRVQRRNFATAYGLNDPSEVHARSATGTLRDRCLFLRKFARYHAPEKHRQLLRGLKRQSELRERILYLQQLRQQGITTLNEEKKEKQPEAAETTASTSTSTEPTTSSSLPSAIDPTAALEDLLAPEEKEFCREYGVSHGVFLQSKKYLLINNRVPTQTELGGLSFRQLFPLQSMLMLWGWRRQSLEEDTQAS